MAAKDERKTAVVNLRMRPSVKALGESLAARDGRSFTQWLERLIEAEAERQKPKGRK